MSKERKQHLNAIEKRTEKQNTDIDFDVLSETPI